jgi:hypothetical protein
MGQVKGGHIQVHRHFFTIHNQWGTILVNGKRTGVSMAVSGGNTNPATHRPQSFYCLPLYATFDGGLVLYSLVLKRAD